ncbi:MULTISPECIES: protein-L-isoaspartate O-methyltransferase [unclassified Azospirillum]|uniref:protein-L-isoaspartate O-methyltransferase family protein n=1 Tax=unclassified Azospirillum TaxID=2630922 RepID=UPI000B6C1DCE|nr:MULTISPECIES: protein-L-isoaspartate O-methyltransferase [unclassified Azospirillum]SNS35682.1 protein-L-isoaspartate(D-aspartate) O-methyltransferase [Azospirillum sp. RU38E]SNS53998.1 protein-L-isoaspartate(D-aspartate) O-methyltransferase [Azospirillum sp. RU37A]
MIATTEYSAARYNMVESQLRPNKVSDQRLVDAFLAVPRDQFVPPALRGVAYVDKAIPLGNGRFLLEPMVLGRLLQEARIAATDLVLDVGTATGYSAAIIGQIAATVVAVESDAALAAQANQAMQTLGVDNAAIVQGTLAAGWAKQGPYDVIVLEGAVAAVPQALLDQLAEGGRLVTVLLPESGVAVARLYQKIGGTISSRTLFDASADLLPGMEPKAAFAF